jgi:hypothetical protein
MTPAVKKDVKQSAVTVVLLSLFFVGLLLSLKALGG